MDNNVKYSKFDQRKLSMNENIVAARGAYSKGKTLAHDHHHPDITNIWRRKMTTWFHRWDSNGDGKLTLTDFFLLAERLEKYCKDANPRIRKVFVYLWENFVSPEEPSHIGVVTLDEWLRTHAKSMLEWDKNPTISASLIGAFGLLFDVLDNDNSGDISITEYKAFFHIMNISEELAPEAFARMDVNNDGAVSRDEFLTTVMSYYCDLNPTPLELAHSLWLGPLTDSDSQTSSNVDVITLSQRYGGTSGVQRTSISQNHRL